MPPIIERRVRALLPSLRGDAVQAFEAADAGHDFEIRAVAAGEGHLAIVRDITEASRTRRALDVQRRFLRAIVDTDENLIAVRDADGRYTLCNVAYCDALLLDPAHMEGRRPDELARHEVLAPLLRGDEAVLRGESEWRADRVQLADARGETRWLQVLKRPVEGEDGATQVLTVAVDVTARLRAERLKNEFVSTVSHELRTPLTSIRGALSMLRSGMVGDLPEAAGPLVEIADKNTERLVRLINDILDIEKLESGRLRLMLRTLDLRPLVAQALEQIEPYARDFDVRLRLHAGDDARVEVDPDRFAQVMANLLSNAIKHSPRGAQVDVALRTVGDGIEVAVQDQGAGIPPEFQARVFERFAQADGSDARVRGGTGLGLAITRSLVEQMGGTIGFASRPGEGTRFRVWLPGVAAPSGPRAEDRGGQPRIVLLQDDADTARELAALLEPHGYAVDVAVDVAHARVLLAGDDARGVAIDLALAGDAGPAFLREMRAQPRYRHLPVLLIGVHDEETLRGGAVGVVDWLSKPLEPSRVAEAVRRCLHGGDRERPEVLHVEDDPDVRTVVARLLAHEPLRLHQAATLAGARAELAARHHDLVILDLMLPDGDGAELLPELGASRPPVPAIIFSAQDMDLPESRVVLHRLVKSRSDARQLAALIVENLKHWPVHGPRHEDAG
jgi:PAS domain S-box-containing protein